jgi:hypothetical protein
LSPETLLAAKKIEATEGDYAIEATALATPGSRVAVKWRGPQGGGIFLTIVEKKPKVRAFLDYLYLSVPLNLTH